MNKKLLTGAIAAVFVTAVFLGTLMLNVNYAKPAYEGYVNTIVDRHVDKSSVYIALTGDYRKHSEKDMDMSKVLKKHSESFDSEITVLVADKLTSEEYEKICEDLFMDLGRNHVKCDISVCMVDKKDLDTNNPGKVLEGKTILKGHIN